MVQRRFPRVRILHTDNIGYAHAVNTGMTAIKTDLAIISNADILLDKGCLEILEREFLNDNRIGLLGCAIYDPDRKKVTRFSRTSVLRGMTLELIPKALRGKWRDAEQKVYDAASPFDVTFVEGALMAIRRSLFREIGGMDEGFSFFYEDADFPIRVMKSGFRVVHVPAAGATHIGSASFSQVPMKHAEEFYRNMVRLYRRHALRRALWLRRGLRALLQTKNLALDGFKSVIPGSESLIERTNAILSSLSLDADVSDPESNPLVSVIVPTYRRPDQLKALLSTLRGQSYKNFEVIIVDQTDEKARPAPSLKLKQPMTRILLKWPNRSLAKNLGIQHARGSLLLFCDDDILVEKEFIETHVRFHQENHTAGVSCRTLEQGLPALTSSNICRVTWYGKLVDGFQSDITCFTGTLVGGNMSIKRRLMSEAGYFDQMYKGTSIFEEQDISERLKSLGYKLVFTNGSSVRHVPQEDGNIGMRARRPSEYYHDFHHNEMVYFLKNRNHLLLPFVICFCFLRSIKQSIRAGLSFRQGLHMLMGVPAGFQSYYQSLK